MCWGQSGIGRISVAPRAHNLLVFRGQRGPAPGRNIPIKAVSGAAAGVPCSRGQMAPRWPCSRAHGHPAAYVLIISSSLCSAFPLPGWHDRRSMGCPASRGLWKGGGGQAAVLGRVLGVPPSVGPPGPGRRTFSPVKAGHGGDVGAGRGEKNARILPRSCFYL